MHEDVFFMSALGCMYEQGKEEAVEDFFFKSPSPYEAVPRERVMTCMCVIQ